MGITWANARLARMVGALVLLAVLGGWVDQTAARAAPAPVAEHPPWAAVAAAEVHSGSASLASTAAFSETLVFDITEYVANNHVTINISSALEGPIQSGAEWTLCAGATNVTVDSAGGACQKDPLADKIACSAAVPRIDIAYTCTVAFQGIYTVVVFQFEWLFDEPVDRATEVRYPAHLTYLEADPEPTEQLPGKLRWLQQDVTTFTSQIAFQDTDIKSIYLPLVVR